MLRRYTAYMMKSLAWPTLLIAVSLTSIIWLTQALRYIDFTINRGLGIADFIYLTALLVPSLMLIILPIALFVAVVFCYHRLAAESELVVLKAAGLSPLQLARPAILMGLLVTMLCYALSLYLMPATKRQFKDMQSFLRDNYTSVLLQEEVFNSPVDGLTVFVRQRDPQGVLRGILVHDNRLDGQEVTMMAEEARLMQTPAGPRFYLVNGMRQEMQKGRISWLNFDSYNLDLSLYTENRNQRERGAEELFLPELLHPDTTDETLRRKYMTEVHQRFSWPIYALGLALLAVAAMLAGEFNRRGQWRRIALVSGAAVGVVIAAAGLANLTARHPGFVPLVYGAASMFITGCLVFLIRERAHSIPERDAEFHASAAGG
jgi:lipopolysaccharide export system permease protein